jgi:hypothetical protein
MKRVKVTSLTAPHGRTFDSLRIEHDKGIVGHVQSGPCELGYYKVLFPSVEKPLEVHRTMLTEVR